MTRDARRMRPVIEGPIYTDRCEDPECEHTQNWHLRVAPREKSSLDGFMVPCRYAGCSCPRYRSPWWDQAMMA